MRTIFTPWIQLVSATFCPREYLKSCVEIKAFSWTLIEFVFKATLVTDLIPLDIEIIFSGTEAVKRLERGPVLDIVLIGFHLPSMEGGRVLKKMCKIPAWANVPVIAITAYPKAEEKLNRVKETVRLDGV
jgi:CheY-like chemotaxis protein